MRNIWLGTSGWTYKDWRGTFYPSNLPARSWLSRYAEQFPTTEINGSFYRTPSLEAVRAWRNGTPDGFVFAWKASKVITHWKRLTDKCRNSLELMETRLKALEPKVGPILFQLPPQLSPDRDRLAGFLIRRDSGRVRTGGDVGGSGMHTDGAKRASLSTLHEAMADV